MFQVLLTLIIIASILLVLVILAQKSKGGGLSGQFGGSASQILGAHRSSNMLEKLTWGLALAIVTLSLASKGFLNQPGQGESASPNLKNQPFATPSEEAPVQNEATPEEATPKAPKEEQKEEKK